MSITPIVMKTKKNDHRINCTFCQYTNLKLEVTFVTQADEGKMKTVLLQNDVINLCFKQIF